MIMVPFNIPAILVFCTFLTCSWAEVQSGKDLHGTWSSKSNQVFTGPGFFDPVDELLIEPSLPGISYSFTEDGFYEEAAYRVSGNPRNPSCPVAVLTFQHGKYTILQNGSMVLKPFSVDGRQLVSDPCNDKGKSQYVRYSHDTLFERFTVELDDYHGKQKLQLYAFDGSPLQPLYLAFKPPQMLPTVTLRPTAARGIEITTTNSPKRSLRDTVKRSLENKYKTNAVKKQSVFNSEFYWWCGAALIGVGSLAFFTI
ncbi:HER161Wp [Eremothecium sinecaudum]|uniref:Protein ROT1 n=1 Tax=Eremothecium sinecaudum TaxID=45286 RepID=A0A0X8HU35_9SACH|nr:HER161Wp [Eremothecium sinecaudum]AMD21440.1 HER161Wp [Eremothecium sinecaudum]